MLAISLIKAFLIDNEPRLLGHLKRHLKREAERIVKLERRLTADLSLAVGLELFSDLVKHRLALVERLIKAILLSFEIGLASHEILGELGIDVFILLANRLGELNRKARGNPEESAVAHGAADETAKNVVRADIAGLDAALRIAENERRRTHVIGDDAARLKRELSVFGRYRRKLIDLRHDRRENLGIINGRRA